MSSPCSFSVKHSARVGQSATIRVMLLAAASILLQPELPELRWVYLMTNLQVARNADAACDLIVRAKKSGYNGLVLSDTKLQRLNKVPDFYFTNARKVIDCANREGFEIIPCIWPVGYASAMLSHDVNLIEGLPVRNQTFVIKAGEARPDAEGVELLANGGLEEAKGHQIQGLQFQDGAGQSSFVDRTEKKSGAQSIRLESFRSGNEAGNARLCWKAAVKPFHHYILKGWSKREGLQGLCQAIALDSKGRSLTAGEMEGGANQGWKEFKFSFNSLENSEVNVYVGVWGGSAGKVWWDDISVQEAGLLNVIRRPGAPLSVTDENGRKLEEGRDFEAVLDPGLGVTPWEGEYDLNHTAPSLRMKGAAALPDGSKLKVSFFHAKTALHGQAAICLSEPKTLEFMEREAAEVIKLFRPKGLFWSHDEIRVGGWCEACQRRGLKPGQILAENLRACARIQQKLLPGSTPYIWSDMVDPYHNAVNGYYLTNGTLAESWRGLPQNMVVVNWNSGKPKESLPFFAGLGHRQILAGYYDGSVDSIKSWKAEAVRTGSLKGIMYTTWVGDYSNLERFADAAWGGR